MRLVHIASSLSLTKQFNFYLYRDIMPILGEPELFETLINILCSRVKLYQFDRILGIESRGFLIGPLMAQKLRVPFGPIRKKGKLPGELYSIDYDLEYGKDTLQVQKDGLPTGSKCLIVDDLVATGGSLEAAQKLVKLSKSEVAAYVVVIELEALQGRKKLTDAPIVTIFQF